MKQNFENISTFDDPEAGEMKKLIKRRNQFKRKEQQKYEKKIKKLTEKVGSFRYVNVKITKWRDVQLFSTPKKYKLQRN